MPVIELRGRSPRLTQSDVDTLKSLRDQADRKLELLEHRALKAIELLRAGCEIESEELVRVKEATDESGCRVTRLYCGPVQIYEEIAGSAGRVERRRP